jgi:hypothetical protein
MIYTLIAVCVGCFVVNKFFAWAMAWSEAIYFWLADATVCWRLAGQIKGITFVERCDYTTALLRSLSCHIAE